MFGKQLLKNKENQPQMNTDKNGLRRNFVRKLSALICVYLWLIISLPVSAHEGEDHSKDAKTTAATTTATAETVSVVTAERNISGESGAFNLVLKRSPMSKC